MDSKTRDLYTARAAILKAMAHPTRLFIVDMLSKQDYCVAEITEAVGSDMSTVSRHLAVIKNAGIIAQKKRGTKIFYTLMAPCVMNFFSCIESVMKSSAVRQIKMVK